MNPVQNLISDLRDKHLWPVAAALVVALIAVPLLLSSSSSPAPAPTTSPVVAAAPTPPVGIPSVSVVAAPSNARLVGPARDPFAQRPVAAAPSTTTTGATTATTVGATSATTSHAAAVTTGTGRAGTATVTPPGSSTTITVPTAASSPPPVTFLVFSVDMLFGQQGHEKKLKDVARLTPLPSATNPLLVFLGVKNDRRTAVFLVSSLASPTGQGTCTPKPTQCEFLSLKLGQAESLLTVNSHGGADIYNLGLTGVRLTPTRSADVASRADARVSNAGRKLFGRGGPLSLALRSLGFLATATSG